MNKYILAAGALLLSATVFSARAAIITETYQLEVTNITGEQAWSALSVGQVFDITIESNDPSDTDLAFYTNFGVNRGDLTTCAFNYSGNETCANEATKSDILEASNILNFASLDLSALFNIPETVTTKRPGNPSFYTNSRILVPAIPGIAERAVISLTDIVAGYGLNFRTATNPGGSFGFASLAGTTNGEPGEKFVQINLGLVQGVASDLNLNASVSVPAPATFALMLIGLFGLGVTRKTKARK